MKKAERILFAGASQEPFLIWKNPCVVSILIDPRMQKWKTPPPLVSDRRRWSEPIACTSDNQVHFPSPRTPPPIVSPVNFDQGSSAPSSGLQPAGATCRICGGQHEEIYCLYLAMNQQPVEVAASSHASAGTRNYADEGWWYRCQTHPQRWCLPRRSYQTLTTLAQRAWRKRKERKRKAAAAACKSRRDEARGQCGNVCRCHWCCFPIHKIGLKDRPRKGLATFTKYQVWKQFFHSTPEPNEIKKVWALKKEPLLVMGSCWGSVYTILVFEIMIAHPWFKNQSSHCTSDFPMFSWLMWKIAVKIENLSLYLNLSLVCENCSELHSNRFWRKF